MNAEGRAKKWVVEPGGGAQRKEDHSNSGEQQLPTLGACGRGIGGDPPQGKETLGLGVMAGPVRLGGGQGARPKSGWKSALLPLISRRCSRVCERS